MTDKITETFTNLLNDCDADSDGSMGWGEFAKFLETDACQRELRRFDVDVDALIDIVEDMFFLTDAQVDSISISFHQIIELILQLRGSETATVKDVMIIGKRINTKFYELKQIMNLALPC